MPGGIKHRDERDDVERGRRDWSTGDSAEREDMHPSISVPSVGSSYRQALQA
jgi:hypothetical protein